ncbi:MAG: hypothetical protein L6V81_05835 [Clostridium sp.]|nr:MAG: hypothetical protein L6V81_05835 [Clostridium sp.]
MFDFKVVTGTSHYVTGFMTAIYCLSLLLIVLLMFFLIRVSIMINLLDVN